MTTVADIIRDAYRESNLIAINALPSGEQQEEGLTALARIISSVYGNEAGEQLNPFLIGRNNISQPSGFPYYETLPVGWYVPQNVRLILNLVNPQIVYLDPNPTDGQRFAFVDASNNLNTNPLTIIGNGRLIQGETSKTYGLDGDKMEFVYRGDLAEWVKVSPIEYFDIFPFPPDFDDVFIIGLAIRLNPRYDRATSLESGAAYEKSLNQFKARYRQHKRMMSELGLIRTPGNRGRYIDDNLAGAFFNAGRPYGGYGYGNYGDY